MLDHSSKEKVLELVPKWTANRRRFTGWEVARKLKINGPDTREVGSFLRELFNGRHPCFKDYACYPVRGKVHPLLFFPAPVWVKRDEKKMQSK